ncbi:hypothetical protein ACJX0J_036870 [Zea mays]
MCGHNILGGVPMTNVGQIGGIISHLNDIYMGRAQEKYRLARYSRSGHKEHFSPNMFLGGRLARLLNIEDPVPNFCYLNNLVFEKKNCVSSMQFIFASIH